MGPRSQNSETLGSSFLHSQALTIHAAWTRTVTDCAPTAPDRRTRAPSMSKTTLIPTVCARKQTPAPTMKTTMRIATMFASLPTIVLSTSKTMWTATVFVNPKTAALTMMKMTLMATQSVSYTIARMMPRSGVPWTVDRVCRTHSAGIISATAKQTVPVMLALVRVQLNVKLVIFALMTPKTTGTATTCAPTLTFALMTLKMTPTATNCAPTLTRVRMTLTTTRTATASVNRCRAFALRAPISTVVWDGALHTRQTCTTAAAVLRTQCAPNARVPVLPNVG
mmetsp:Transcript_52467/g.77682  ORF Transcript_52467/g.77682 Transcript_52467/m.77682 type:complete len:281 (+) Transcript_52467:535-1377(+)